MPQEVADAFTALHGVDVAEVPVHRGPAVDAQAIELGAAAFTRGGEVFLPDTLGPLTHSRTHGVLAHELTHAVQQRAAGPAAPTPTSAAQALDTMERAARWTERRFHRAQTLVHRRTEPAAPPVDPEPVTNASTGSAPADSPVQRITLDELMPAPPLPMPDATPVPTDAPPAIDEYAGARPAPAVPRELADLLAHQDRLVELCTSRPPDLDDPYSMDELAAALFGRMHRLLRAELLLDRERAGRLADAN